MGAGGGCGWKDGDAKLGEDLVALDEATQSARQVKTKSSVPFRGEWKWTKHRREKSETSYDKSVSRQRVTGGDKEPAEWMVLTKDAGARVRVCVMVLCAVDAQSVQYWMVVTVQV